VVIVTVKRNETKQTGQS